VYRQVLPLYGTARSSRGRRKSMGSPAVVPALARSARGSASPLYTETPTVSSACGSKRKLAGRLADLDSCSVNKHQPALLGPASGGSRVADVLCFPPPLLGPSVGLSLGDLIAVGEDGFDENELMLGKQRSVVSFQQAADFAQNHSLSLAGVAHTLSLSGLFACPSVSALGDCLLIVLIYSLPRSHSAWPVLSLLSADAVRSFFISEVRLLPTLAFDTVMGIMEPIDRRSKKNFIADYEPKRRFLGPDFAVFAIAVLGGGNFSLIQRSAGRLPSDHWHHLSSEVVVWHVAIPRCMAAHTAPRSPFTVNLLHENGNHYLPLFAGNSVHLTGELLSLPLKAVYSPLTPRLLNAPLPPPPPLPRPPPPGLPAPVGRLVARANAPPRAQLLHSLVFVTWHDTILATPVGRSLAGIVLKREQMEEVLSVCPPPFACCAGWVDPHALTLDG
jgi:hypothetical protein